MDPLDPLETARRRTGVPWLDVVVGASAMLIATISLVVALRQSQIMEKQLAASVWPYLQYGTSNGTDDGKQVIRFEVENVGVGPARVHSVSLLYDGKPLHNLRELVTACCADLLETKGKASWWISTLNRQVLTPNRSKAFLTLTDAPANAAWWERLNTERNKVQFKTCYCSVLDDCWLLDSHKDDREPVKACPAPGPDDFDG